jgi:anti-sigma regulatory factor (Ser/Thr protein kinase)/ActR/RegA family two-component response regulator
VAGDSVSRALLIDAEPPFVEGLARSPSLAGVDLDVAVGEADALRRLRRYAYPVLVSSPRTSLSSDLALLDEIRAARPGVRTILLSPEATPEEVIVALRERVFACFSVPFDAGELADMMRRAIDAEDWRNGIEVVSAQRNWVSLRVACRLLTADRLVAFLKELRSDVPDEERDHLILGFREVLLNAMEHGGGFDPHKVVEVSAVRTERAIVYYVRDPGAGFEPARLPHAAVSNPPGDPVAHLAVRAEMGLRPGGFGLLVARQVVDELIHSELGNEVLMIRHTR